MRVLSDAFLVIFVFFVLFGLVTLAQYFYFFYMRRLSKRIAKNSICFYTDKIVYGLNESCLVYIYGQGDVSILLSSPFSENSVYQEVVRGKCLNSSRLYKPWSGMGWTVSQKISLTGVKPGVYFLTVKSKADDSNNFSSVIFVNDPSRNTDVVSLVSSNTWNAYNYFGGLSNYKNTIVPYPLKIFFTIFNLLNIRMKFSDNHIFPITPLSKLRPNVAINSEILRYKTNKNDFFHLIGLELKLYEFFSANDIHVSFVDDGHFELYGLPEKSKLFFIAGHSEYWSDEMLFQLKKISHQSVSVVVASGNNAYRKILNHGDRIEVVAQENDCEAVSKIFGAFYDARGYLSFAPYAVTKKDHWLFNGLDISSSGNVGLSSLSKYHGSGYETDKVTQYTPAVFTEVAIGQNMSGPAKILVRDRSENNFFINFCSVSVLLSLEEVAMKKIFLNIVNRSLN